MSAGRRAPRAGRVRSHGYTAVEVMLAMAVLLISSAGVMSMQKAAILGNLDARKLDVANAVARTWLDRLAADATVWNSNSPITVTNWLNTGRDTGLFLTPATLPTNHPTWSPAFDIMGRDLTTANDPTTVFCTHIKLDTVAVDVTNNPTIIRATVMVFWATSVLGSPAPPTTSICPGPGDLSQDAKPGTYHTVFATESLRRAS